MVNHIILNKLCGVLFKPGSTEFGEARQEIEKMKGDQNMIRFMLFYAEALLNEVHTLMSSHEDCAGYHFRFELVSSLSFLWSSL